MVLNDALDIFEKYNRKSYLNENEEEEFFSALLFLIDATQDPYYMTYYGGCFYEKKDFVTAKKYYEKAAKFKYPPAYLCLGYIYYYGRVGEPDYKKAFMWYKKASESDIDEASYKLADMYKNGYGVEQNYDKFVKIIENLYNKYKHYKFDPESRVGVLTRIARIRKSQGDNKEALKMFFLAKAIIVDERLPINPFFGDINVIKWITQDIYSIQDFNYDNFDLFDVFFLLDKANVIVFEYEGHEFEILIKREDEKYKILFQGKEYKSYEEFLGKAQLDNEAIAAQARNLHNFKYQ